jgi:hypothetical protein
MDQTLRCKLGDMCWVSKSEMGNYGKVVTTQEYIGIMQVVLPNGSTVDMAMWRVDKQLTALNGTTDLCPDECLTPILPDGDNLNIEEEEDLYKSEDLVGIV